MNSFVKVGLAVIFVASLSFPKAEAGTVCEAYGELAYQIMKNRQSGATKSEIQAYVSSDVGLELMNQAFDEPIVSKRRAPQFTNEFSQKFIRICDILTK